MTASGAALMPLHDISSNSKMQLANAAHTPTLAAAVQQQQLHNGGAQMQQPMQLGGFVTVKQDPDAAVPLAIANQQADASAGASLPVKQESASVVRASSETPAVSPYMGPVATPPHKAEAGSSPVDAMTLGPAATDAAAEAAKPKLPPLQPLPPPDPSEAPSVHAEYAAYLERFKAGDTLAQRWHRLAEKGKIEELREEWEDWEHDLMLQQLQAQIGNGGGRGRGRGRGKRDEVELMSLDDLGPRKSRQRRVPSTLQDYQVDTPVSASPAPGMARDDAANASACPSGVAADGVDHEVESFSDGADASQQCARSTQQQQHQRHIVQHRVYRPPAGQGSAPPYQHQVVRSSAPPQAQQPWSKWVPSQAQQVQQPPPQQLQPPAGGAAASNGGSGAASAPLFSPEILQQFFQAGQQAGQQYNVNQGAAGGVGGAGAAQQQQPGFSHPNPQALAKAMEQMCMTMFGGDMQAMMRQLSAAMGPQQGQHQL